MAYTPLKTTLGPRGRGLGDACCAPCARAGGSCGGGMGAAPITIAGIGIGLPVLAGLGLMFLALHRTRPRKRR